MLHGTHSTKPLFYTAKCTIIVNIYDACEWNQRVRCRLYIFNYNFNIRALMFVSNGTYFRRWCWTGDITFVSVCVSSAGPPRWTQKKDNIHLVVKPAASTVVLKCPAEGMPEPSIEWLKNGMPFNQRTVGQVGVSWNIHHHNNSCWHHGTL